MRAEHVALPGDDPQLRVAADQFPGLGEVGGHHDAGQQVRQRRRQTVLGPHQREGGMGTIRQPEARR